MNTFLRSRNKGIYAFLIMLWVILFTQLFSFAQVKISAVCPNSKIGKDDFLQVEYKVENAFNVQQFDVQEITPPSFKNFSLVSGPNNQSSKSIINGVVSQSVSVGYVLKPNATGTFTLPPATAKVNGKNYTSNSITIRVTNQSQGNASGGVAVNPFSNMMNDFFAEPSTRQYDDYILRKGENINEKIRKNLFVKVEVNKTSCYVGEPVVATYKLYSRLKSESNVTRSPSFNGFSVSDMPVPDNFSSLTEKYNGRNYNVYILRKVQLYPLQPDTITLEPIEVENHITFIKSEYANARKGDIFYDMLQDFANATTPAEGMEEQKVTVKSNPLGVVVKPLPALNKPKDFKGATGDFSINASLEKNAITTDEAGKLTVTISGTGNMEMINAPSIAWPDGIEFFEPKSSENIDKTAVPLKGEKTFSYPFTVSSPGKYVIPAITFSFFDMRSHGYKTLATTAFSLTVEKGKGINNMIAANIDGKKSNISSGGDNAFIMWASVFLFAGIFISGVLFLYFKKSKQQKNKQEILPVQKITTQNLSIAKDADKTIVPANYLYAAEQKLMENSPVDFYAALNSGLKNYLSNKLNYPEKELTRKKINELLDSRNVPIGTALMTSSLMENIELNLYAPLSSSHQMEEAYEKATEVVSLLEKQLG